MIHKITFIIFLLLCVQTTSAGIYIDSVRVVNTSCYNNGEFKIYARCDRCPLVYKLINSSNSIPNLTGYFRNLSANDFYIKIFNYYNEDTIIKVKINSTYTSLSLVLDSIYMGCDNDKGYIQVSGKNGKKPYNWKVYKDSLTNHFSNSNSISNLGVGNYIFKLRDDCHNEAYQIYNISHSKFLNYNRINFRAISCDKVEINHDVSISDNSFVKVIYQYGIYTVRDSIYNFKTYKKNLDNLKSGDSIQITYITACNDSFVTMEHIPKSQVFIDNDNHLENNYCNQIDTTRIYSVISNFDKFDLWLYNSNGTLLEAAYNQNYYFKNTNGLVIGDRYIAKIKNICNEIKYDTFRIPNFDTLKIKTSSILKVTISVNSNSILDSTASINVTLIDKNNNQPKFRILSGVKYIHSSNPSFIYTDSNVFDKEITSSTQIVNLGAGYYPYIAYNNCGDTIFGSFEIKQSDLKGVEQIKYKIDSSGKFCGRYKVLIQFFMDSFYKNYQTRSYQLNNLSSNFNYWNYTLSKNDTFNLTENYDGNTMDIAVYPYEMNNGIVPSLFRFNTLNQNYSKKILIPSINMQFKRAEVDFINTIQCNQYTNIEIKVKNGAPPFRYQLIAPDTILYQDSNLFQIKSIGEYRLLIHDSCNYTNSYNFAFDTFPFPPFVLNGSFCIGSNAFISYPSSKYFKYQWTSPSGNKYIGDTFKIYNFNQNDIGTYSVTKFIDFEGCKDTFTTNFEINPYITISVKDTICEFDTFLFGKKILITPGIYRDTLSTIHCDSISILNLFQKKLTLVNQNISLCMGGVLNHNGLRYYSDTILLDTFRINKKDKCKTIMKFDIKVSDFQKDTISESICMEDSFLFGGKFIKNEGYFSDTFLRNDCYQIRTLSLHKIPYKNEVWERYKCYDDSFVFNKKVYKNEVQKTDTFKLNQLDQCRTIVSLILKNYPLDTQLWHKTICYHDSFIFNNLTLKQDTILVDTFKTSLLDLCKSKVTLILNRFPIQKKDTAIQSNYEVKFNDLVYIKPYYKGVSFYWDYNNSRQQFFYDKFINEFNDLECNVIDEYNCQYSCHYKITVNGDLGYLDMPSAFSPNGDNLNDVLHPIIENVDITNFSVYNRWGEKVFYTDAENVGWNGKYKNELCPSGIYSYVIEYNSGFRKAIFIKTGEVFLSR